MVVTAEQKAVDLLYRPYVVSTKHRAYVMKQYLKFRALGHSRSEALLEAWRDSYMKLYQSLKDKNYVHITFQRLEKNVTSEKPRYTRRIIARFGGVDGFFDDDFIYTHRVKILPYSIAKVHGWWNKNTINEGVFS